MYNRVKFIITFRMRLLLLLASFLLLSITLVLVLDKWVSKRAVAVIEEQNRQVTEAVNMGYVDLAEATSLAMQSLTSDQFLYQMIDPQELPRTIEFIIVAEKEGKVRDSTKPELVGQFVPVPKEERSQVWSEDPVVKEDETHEHEPKTYFHPVTTTKGLFWIMIVTTQQAIINKIEEASETLSYKNRELSNYRFGATTGLLMTALVMVVGIGWQFTRPIQELVSAARRVASGDLDFRVGINRRDEVGQLASTFNEMIAGLKLKLELEEKLSQSERAAAIGRLTQAVAHEIRNPLNVLNLSIDHVSTKFAPEDETRRTQFLRVVSAIKDEIARLRHMANDLLDYGRPAKLDIERLDLRKLVEDTITLIGAQADQQGVEVNLEEEGLPAEVQGDAERLKSCISNIAINALQAMPEGGHLTARVHRTNGTIEVSVSDTGVGISEEAIDKVFEPYFSTKKTGFGLGLAVTKKIVQEHNGSIDVRSQIGHGTTFTMKLPAADDKE